MGHHNREVEYMTMESRNEVQVAGVALEDPAWSHENHGMQFYRFMLQVPRLSGQADILPVLLPEQLRSAVKKDLPVRGQGQLRSFNNRSGMGNRLVLTIYAQTVEPGGGEGENHIALIGALCKPPILRRTPLGRSICDLMLAVPRRYGRADYLPVIAWGQLAAQCAALEVGDRLALEGRVQSRVYHKVVDGTAQERVAYEVSMMLLIQE